MYTCSSLPSQKIEAVQHGCSWSPFASCRKGKIKIKKYNIRWVPRRVGVIRLLKQTKSGCPGGELRQDLLLGTMKKTIRRRKGHDCWSVAALCPCRRRSRCYTSKMPIRRWGGRQNQTFSPANNVLRTLFTISLAAGVVSPKSRRNIYWTN